MSDNLKPIFEKKVVPGIYVVDREAEFETLRSLSDEFQFTSIYLDGAKITSFQTFHDELKKILSFPYMGQNWNAIYDCLVDLSPLPLPKQGYVLFFKDFQNFARRDKNNFSLAIEVMQDATEFWKDSDTPMYVLLKGDNSIVPNLHGL